MKKSRTKAPGSGTKPSRASLADDGVGDGDTKKTKPKKKVAGPTASTPSGRPRRSEALTTRTWAAELDELCDKVDGLLSRQQKEQDQKDTAKAAAASAASEASAASDALVETSEATGVTTRSSTSQASQASTKTEVADGFVGLMRGLPDGFGPDVEAGVAKAIHAACRIASDVAMLSGSRTDAEVEDDADLEDGGLSARLAEDRARVHRVLSVLYYASQAVSASTVAWRILSSEGGKDAVGDGDLAAGVSRFSAPDAEEANRMQQLLLYLLNTAQIRGYRRRHGDLYRRKVSTCPRYAAHDTHAWERVSDMRDFVYDVTRKEVNFDMWLNLTCMRTNVQAAVDHLTVCHDVQLPELHLDRHVFSFRDGIYLAAQDRFVRYGTRAHAALPTDLVAARYFDALLGETLRKSFTEEADDTDSEDSDTSDDSEDDPEAVKAAVAADWYTALPTPHLQSILDYQEMGEEVSRWMYALIGRLIYEVNELDGWQVLPFLKGAASSGKSTILTRVCRNLYEASEVGTLSNNIERKFGLSALADKLLFIGPEIKSDIALEQAEFQSIVSGETVQVAAKFKTATTVVWRVPGALAGNEVPGWVDNSGSINRRIVIFDFPRRVHDGDMELGRKIELEMPATLVKCNRAYLEAVARYAKDNIWKHLPAAFHASKDDFSESINSIVHFLRSGQLEYGTGHYMPFENFASAYEAYVASMGLTRMKLTGDKVSQPLLEANCRVVKNQTMRYPRPAAAAAAAGTSGAAAGSSGTGGGSSGGSFGGGGFGSHASSVMTGRFIIGCDVAPRVAQQMCFSGQGDDLPF